MTPEQETEIRKRDQASKSKDREILALQEGQEQLRQERDDAEEALRDKRRLAAEIGRIWNGADAAKNPAMCDLVTQLRKEVPILRRELAEARSRESRLGYQLMTIKNWLLFGLQHGLAYYGDTDQSGHPHGYAAFAVPDWKARQLLEEIEVAMKGGQDA